MYQVEFVATNSEDWAEAVEFYDASGTCGASELIPLDAEFSLSVTDRKSPVLKASTADGTITRVSPSVISWRFTKEQTRQLSPGNTYQVGLTMSANGTEQILIGNLSFLDGVVR